MKNKINILIIGTVIVLIISYLSFNHMQKKDVKNSIDTTKEKTVDTNSRQLALKESLVKKYGAMSDWEIKSEYTIDTQELFTKNSIVLFESVFIEDIFNENGKQFISFNHYSSSLFDYSVKLECSNNIDTIRLSNSGTYMIVAKIDNIKKEKNTDYFYINNNINLVANENSDLSINSSGVDEFRIYNPISIYGNCIEAVNEL